LWELACRGFAQSVTASTGDEWSGSDSLVTTDNHSYLIATRQKVAQLKCGVRLLSSFDWSGPIAGKPAPTGIRGVNQIASTLKNLWELACQR
jgi:hypothetical protein